MAVTALARAEERATALMNRLKNSREAAKSIAKQALSAVEGIAGASAAGVIDQKWGQNGEEAKMGNIPINLAAGIALHGLAFALEDEKDISPHLHGLGTGFAAAYAYVASKRLFASLDKAA